MDEFRVGTFDAKEKKVMRDHVYNDLNHNTTWSEVIGYQSDTRQGRRGKFETPGVAACLFYHITETMFGRNDLGDCDGMGREEEEAASEPYWNPVAEVRSHKSSLGPPKPPTPSLIAPLYAYPISAQIHTTARNEQPAGKTWNIDAALVVDLLTSNAYKSAGFRASIIGPLNTLSL